MRLGLYTVHVHRRSGQVEVVGEAGALAVLPPVWAIWHGLWIFLAAQVAALVAVGAVAPLGLGAVWAALVAVTWADGGAVRRLELRLRGWREAGTVEAASPEGAEELWFTGRSA